MFQKPNKIKRVKLYRISNTSVKVNAKREDIDMDKRRKGLTALDKDVRMSTRDWLKVFEQKSN